MNLTLAAWLHDLSPFLVRFTGNFGLRRWYGLAYAVGFLVGWWWLRWMSRRGMTPISQQRISDAMLILVLGVVVGGRLGYVLFYSRDLLVTFTSSFPWWGVLQLNKGGMASHGGILGVIIASWVISRGVKDESGVRKERAPWMHVVDLTAVACTAGLHAPGRIANFINGELLGKIVAMPGEPAPWWAVKFPQEVFDGQGPAGQVQRVMPLIDQFRIGREPDEVAYQHVLDALQGGGPKAAEVAAKLGPLISSRYPSQLMQAATDGGVLGAARWLIWWKPRLPGVIGCWFLILYGVMRIPTEFQAAARPGTGSA